MITVDIQGRRRSDIGRFLTTMRGLYREATGLPPKRPRVKYPEHEMDHPFGVFERYTATDGCECQACTALKHSHVHDKGPFNEGDHPRGQPENAGEFASKAGAKRNPLLPTAGAGKMRTTAEGLPLPEHITKLTIPPAWTDVHYSENPDADLLASGRDAKGRPQSVYSERFMQANAVKKFARVKELQGKAVEMTEKNEANRLSHLPVVRDVADVTKLIMETGIRPGSDTETGAKVKAYGATTLLGQHVHADASGVSLRFVGKKGVPLNIPITDKATADMLRQRAGRSGHDGKLFPLSNDKKLQGYVKQLSGGVSKPKDLRTHVANHTAMGAIASITPPTNEATYKKAVMEVGKQVSKKLGNTPTIALASYINPAVFAEWRMGAGIA
jgi:DNA topoisomerase-1